MSAFDARESILQALQQTGILSPEALKTVQADESADIDFESLDIDSLSVFDLCLSLEEISGVEIEPEDFIDNRTLSSLAKHLETKKSQ
jgi:acyl carrier protein